MTCNDDQNNIKDKKLLPILSYNKSALSHIINGTIKAWTKYVDVCYHNSYHLSQYCTVMYSLVSTQGNVASIIKNALPREKHEKFTNAMGLL